MLFELENYQNGNLNDRCHGVFAVFRPKLRNRSFSRLLEVDTSPEYLGPSHKSIV